MFDLCGLCRCTPAPLRDAKASFVIGWRGGQERGGAIVGEGPFELYCSDLVQHVTSSLLGQRLRVVVLAGGRRSLGLVVGAVVWPGGLYLGSGGLELVLVLVLMLVHLLFLLLAQLVDVILVWLMLLQLLGMLRQRLLILKLLLNLELLVVLL